jgi:hypothetical protein
MKFFVLSICALLALSSTAIAQNISAEDFDLACAVTAGAIFGSNPKGGAERDASKMVWTFYVGRLTGRDDKTIWNTVIKGRIAEMGESLKSCTGNASISTRLRRQSRWRHQLRFHLR